MGHSELQVKSYRDLIAWRKTISLVLDIYKATLSFPREELYGLSSQLRRAAASISSNIAEGHGRATSGEFVQFLCHARRSLKSKRKLSLLANWVTSLASKNIS